MIRAASMPASRNKPNKTQHHLRTMLPPVDALYLFIYFKINCLLESSHVNWIHNQQISKTQPTWKILKDQQSRLPACCHRLKVQWTYFFKQTNAQCGVCEMLKEGRNWHYIITVIWISLHPCREKTLKGIIISVFLVFVFKWNENSHFTDKFDFSKQFKREMCCSFWKW